MKACANALQAPQQPGNRTVEDAPEDKEHFFTHLVKFPSKSIRGRTLSEGTMGGCKTREPGAEAAPGTAMLNGKAGRGILNTQRYSHHFQPAHLVLPANLGTGTKVKHATHSRADDAQGARTQASCWHSAQVACCPRLPFSWLPTSQTQGY